MRYKCLKCGLELNEYSRPHMPAEKPAVARAIAANAFRGWANLADMPDSIWRSREVCWGTVVDSPKWNGPVNT
jgi:hypothetical protein